MKRAWELAGDLYWNAKPVIRSEEEQTWTANLETQRFYDQILSLDWGSNVPGSGAPECIMTAAIQALENRGYRASERAYELLEEGLAARKAEDFIRLQQVSAELRYELARAEKDESSTYWSYGQYDSFAAYEKAVSFPEARPVDLEAPRFREQLKGAWLSQLIGAAMGTMVEGYTSQNLYEAFGEVYEYLREPNTYNDDITYELAFLDAFSKYGYNLTSSEIALAWAGLIPCGWSAEEIALRNIKNGILPPESGTYRNPFNEWIGAQMKGGICGLAAPGDAKLAARLAWADGEVAHANNGILGEVFNAVLTSLAFTEQDVRHLVRRAIDLIPADSEYYAVVSFAWDCCEKYEDWHLALADCQEQYKTYNWIHAYPNACCEVIALYYGNGDYTKTLHIVTMCGVDVDCNAGMIMPILAIQQGMGIIPKKLIHPAFSQLITYMRGMRRIGLEELVDDTLNSILHAKKQGGD
ncbi:MAG: ADP-ribosylglycohydrolase family protein [Lachnospiraceae bacterium]|nr:ADP-ribosylglycohydrolase family protein [Lachnospiraceae bacterium]